MNENKFLLGSGILLCAALVFAASVFWYPSRGSNMARPNAAAPKDTAAKIVEGTSYISKVPPAAGVVVTAGSNSVVMNVKDLDGKLQKVTIQIDSETEIYKRGTSKDANAYQKEMDAFLAKIENAGDAGVVYIAPDRFEHIAVKTSELAAGTSVIVQFRATEDKTKLVAYNILVGPAAQE